MAAVWRLVQAAALLHAASCLAPAAVVELDATSFGQNINVDRTRPWLVEFVAPWCGHCQALQPKYEAAAAQHVKLQARKGLPPVAFAKVNCEEHKPVCQSAGVDGYPTVMFYPKGVATARKFSGARSEAGILDFVRRMTRQSLQSLVFDDSVPTEVPTDATRWHNASAWAASEGNARVAFLLVAPMTQSATLPAPAGVDLLHRSFAALAERMQDDLTFARARIDALPALSAVGPYETSRERISAVYSTADAVSVVVRVESEARGLDVFVLSNKPGAAGNAAAGSIPHAATTTMKVSGVRVSVTSVPKTSSPHAVSVALEAWVQLRRFPAVTEISPDNFAAIANNVAGAYVALAVLHEQDVHAYAATAAQSHRGAPPRSAAFMHAITRLANREETPLHVRDRDRFVFGWLDATLYNGFLTQFNLSPADAPQLLVIDTPSKRYWHDFTVKEQEDMETFLHDIARGVAPVQRSGTMAIPQRILNMIGPIPFWSAVVAVALLLLWIVYKLIIVEIMRACCADDKSAGTAEREPARDDGYEEADLQEGNDLHEGDDVHEDDHQQQETGGSEGETWNSEEQQRQEMDAASEVIADPVSPSSAGVRKRAARTRE